MTRLRLTGAIAGYDRIAPLRDGSVAPAGIDLELIDLPVEETFFRMLKHREFDVAEMSLSSYVASLQQDPSPFVAIPVFPSRSFRHGCIFVNADAGIERPEDLAGRRIGTPEYEMTAAVWIRGTMEEHHGVPVESPTYLTGGLEEPGRTAKTALDLPSGVDVSPIPDGTTLSEMLAAGELDALYTARMPSSFAGGDPAVRRLFEDYEAVEGAYAASTGIFPIMHTVVIRRDVYESNRWVAMELFKAFEEARQQAREALYDSTALKVMLPWLIRHLEETAERLGDDPWAYGLDANRSTLETFLGYAHRQGTADRRYEAADLFAPETLSRSKV